MRLRLCLRAMCSVTGVRDSGKQVRRQYRLLPEPTRYKIICSCCDIHVGVYNCYEGRHGSHAAFELRVRTRALKCVHACCLKEQSQRQAKLNKAQERCRYDYMASLRKETQSEQKSLMHALACALRESPKSVATEGLAIGGILVIAAAVSGDVLPPLLRAMVGGLGVTVAGASVYRVSEGSGSERRA